MQGIFGRYGELVQEDTMLIKRSYAFVRYARRQDAERAKRALDKTQLKGRIVVRYAEAEHLKSTIAVQFHIARAPNNLTDLVHTCFSKYGNCTVDIPRLKNGHWRRVAFVTFQGDENVSYLAAAEAVRHVKFVSDIAVMIQFARELIPRLPANVSMTKGSKNGAEGPTKAVVPADNQSSRTVDDTLKGAGIPAQLQHSVGNDEWVPIVSYVPKHILQAACAQFENSESAATAHESSYFPSTTYSGYGHVHDGYSQTGWNGMMPPQNQTWFSNGYATSSRSLGNE